MVETLVFVGLEIFSLYVGIPRTASVKELSLV